jgi:FtsP/CotA-like multicopper oxidase with cupredoxin domain
MISRRDFLKISVAGGAASFLAGQARFTRRAYAAQSPQVPLPANLIPQFVDPVTNLLDADHAISDGGTQIELEMREHTTQVLPTGMPQTYVWSYLKPGQETRTSYLGPVIIATRGTPTECKFVNLLGNSMATNVLAYKYGTDQTLHWADPLNGEMNMWNHMAMPPAFGSEAAENYDGPIPACVHLHGGEVPPELDGGPDAWFTSDGQYVGHGFYSKDLQLVDTLTGKVVPQNYNIYRYPNNQEGALIWFHDHTLGATRLNVFCGLAGGYYLTDPAKDPKNLPELFPLVIQDRSFDTNGQFFLPANSNGGVLWSPNPEHPYWVPEFVGDTILVNGKTWPYMKVEPKRYTFMFVNGSNARTYEMTLTDPVSGNPGPALWVICTDGGYLDKPVQVGGVGSGKNNKLVMMSGERYMAIVDFAGFQAGVLGPNGLPYSGNWLLKNTAKAPFPAGAAAIGGTTGQIMQFRVQGTPGNDASFNPAQLGATLRGGTGQGPAVVRLANPATGTLATGVTVQKTRQLTLNEVMGMPQNVIDPVTGVMTPYPGGPLEILVNNTKWNGERINGVKTDPMTGHMMYTFEPREDFTLDKLGWNYLSELPQEGETEIWEIVNLTADAHPIHLHLVQFQLMNRQDFDFAKYNAAYDASFPKGGYDPMTGQPYPGSVYIPAFGPPLNYNTGNPRALGGNPDIAVKDKKGKFLYLKGNPIPPLPQEAGWKDTVIMYPGQVTRIVVRWAPTELPANTAPGNAYFPFDPNSSGQGYVWHCHIVDHEDNEMMRPNEVEPNPNVTKEMRSYIQDVDY